MLVPVVVANQGRRGELNSQLVCEVVMKVMNKLIAWCCGAVLIAVCIPGLGQAAAEDKSVQPNAGPAAIASTSAAGSAGLGVGDLIEVDLFTAPSAQPEFSSKVRVGTDGTIQLPLLGAFHVGGQSLESAETNIASSYIKDGIYKQAQVDLVVLDYGVQHSISVSGEVQKPGVYPMNGAMRLVDAIATAGGLTNRAGQQIAIEHSDASIPTKIVAVPNGASSPEQDPALSAGDKVVVERAGIVYVVGDVNKPGGFVMDNTSNMTVLQALALAEGTKSTAALASARLIRTTPQGRTETSLQLKKIMASQMPDPQLQADDIILVPTSSSKVIARRSAEAAIYTVSGLAIYGRF